MEPVGLTPGRQPVVLHGLHDSMPKAEKPPWKAAASQALDSVVHFSKEISRFPEPARKGPLQACGTLPLRGRSPSGGWLCREGAAGWPRLMLQLSWSSAAALCCSLAPRSGGAGEAREHPPLLWMLREQSLRRFPPAPHPPCAQPPRMCGREKNRGGPRYQRGRRPRPTWRPWGLDDLAGSWAWCEPCCARGPLEPAAVTPHPLLPPQRRSLPPPPPGNVTRPSI